MLTVLSWATGTKSILEIYRASPIELEAWVSQNLFPVANSKLGNTLKKVIGLFLTPSLSRLAIFTDLLLWFGIDLARLIAGFGALGSCRCRIEGVPTVGIMKGAWGDGRK